MSKLSTRRCLALGSMFVVLDRLRWRCLPSAWVAAPRVTSRPRSPPELSTLGTSRSRTGALVMDSPSSSSKGAGPRWTYGIH